jgi:hypothetical protein
VVARAAAVAVLVGLAAESRAIVDLERQISAEPVRISGDQLLRRFDCVRGAVEALPRVPTFVPDGPIDPNMWRQRITEFAFPEVPITHDPNYASQLVSVVPAEPGSAGACDGVRLEVVAVEPTVSEPAGPPAPGP